MALLRVSFQKQYLFIKDKRLLRLYSILSSSHQVETTACAKSLSSAQKDKQQNHATACIVHRGYDSSSSTNTNSGGRRKLNYFRGWAYQQVFLDRRIQYKREKGDDLQKYDDDHHQHHDLDMDRILFFEHNHVYTLGRGADENFLTFLDEEDRKRLCRRNRKSDGGSSSSSSSRLYGDSISQRRIKLDDRLALSVEDEVNAMVEPSPVMGPNKTPIYRIERGGEVTYHGPGQLVCYPLLDLTNDPYKQDLHWYLTCLEEVIIQSLDEIGIVGQRDDINTGVWVGRNKIAAVGVSSSRWITTHGFSLNIDPDLSHFDTSNIIPCGIEGRGVTSISNVFKESDCTNAGREVEPAPCFDHIVNIVIQKFQNVFDIKCHDGCKIF